MEFRDKLLRCTDCRQDFVFSAGEQVFFRDKQFQHEPRHCKPCKAKRTKIAARVETDVVCSECGTLTTVPFLPRQGRPVLCRYCFQRRGADASPGSRRASEG
jgi:CxxC-x17-CxxC domain-containing protein